MGVGRLLRGFEPWMISNVAVGAATASFLNLLVPPFITSVTGSAHRVGIVFAAISLAAVVGPIVARLADRTHLHRLIYLVSLLSGMNYHLTAIPPEFPAPTSSTAFEKGPMTAMFEEGYRLAATGTVWRRTPPGVEPGESPLRRHTTILTYLPRGPEVVVRDGRPLLPPIAPGTLPVPAVPTQK